MTFAAYEKRLKEGSLLHGVVERAISTYGGHVLLSPEKLGQLEPFRDIGFLPAKDKNAKRSLKLWYIFPAISVKPFPDFDFCTVVVVK